LGLKKTGEGGPVEGHHDERAMKTEQKDQHRGKIEKPKGDENLGFPSL